MATIRDVARASGVSIATVSHVLNGRSTKVGAETRDRVLAAVRELRYRPTPLEQNQKAIATQNIGLLAGDLTLSPVTRNHYFAQILEAVIEAGALRGYSTTLLVERMWDDVGHAIRRSYDGRCDGLVLLAPDANGEAVKSLWERGVPLVSVGTMLSLPGISCIDVDNENAMMEGVRFLRRLGHRRIALVGPSVQSVSSLERVRGYLAAMAESGAPADEVCVVFARGDSPQWDDRPLGCQAIERHFGFEDRIFDVVGMGEPATQFVLEEGLPKATAFIGWNDGTAREVAQTLIRLGRRVPEDVSVLGFDDSPDAVSEHPHLTSFRQPYHLIGKTAVNVLLNRILDHRHPDQAVRFVPELVIRESTSSP